MCQGHALVAPRPLSAQKPGETLWWSVLLLGRLHVRGLFARTPWSWTQLRHPWHQTLCLAEWVLLVRYHLPRLLLIHQSERLAAPASHPRIVFPRFFWSFCFRIISLGHIESEVCLLYYTNQKCRCMVCVCHQGRAGPTHGMRLSPREMSQSRWDQKKFTRSSRRRALPGWSRLCLLHDQ